MRDPLNTARTRRYTIGQILTGKRVRTADDLTAIAAFITAATLTAINTATFGLFDSPTADDSVAITSGAAVLTSANSPWVAGDVGKAIDVQGAGVAGATLRSRIKTFTNAGSVILWDNASTTVAPTATSASGLAVWGNDLTLARTTPAVNNEAGTLESSQATLTSLATGASSARSAAARASDFINVMDYGAVGDGATDDRAAIMRAEVVALAAGKTLLFPPAIYAVDNTPGRLGFRVNVVAYGATIKLTAVRDAYATVGNYTESGTKATGITIEGLTVNANNLARAFYFESADTCRVFRCVALNAKEAGIAAYSSTDFEIAGCVVTTVKYLATGQAGTPADGIYFGGCVRPIARDNRISDFRRIGIVAESNGGTKSSGVLIVGNTISNANNCDDSTTEYNAGIWCENTNGGQIIGNRVFGIGGNAGQTSGRLWGVNIVGVGESSAEAMIVSGNHVSVWTGSATPANYAFVMQGTAARQDVVLSSNYAADCARAVHIGTGLGHIVIRDLVADNVKWTVGSDALILVDNAGGAACLSLTIDNVRLTNLNDADATNDAAHIIIYNGAVIPKLSISRVYGFNLQHRATTGAVGRIDITDAEIAYGSATNYGCLKAAEIYCKGVKFTRYAARVVGNFIDTGVNAIRAKFVGCIWDGNAGTNWTMVGANNLDADWTGCSFYNGHAFFPGLTAAIQNFRFTGCLIDEFYAAVGFFNSGGSTTTGMRVFFRGNEFKRSTNVTPIQANGAQPAKSVFAYNTIAGSIVALHDYAGATQDVGTVTA